MPKLSKSLKQECEMLAKTMLYATAYIGKDADKFSGDTIMEFNFSRFFREFNDLHISVYVGCATSVTVQFYSDHQLVDLDKLFTFKQLIKLGFDTSYALHFGYSEAYKKLFKMLKYLYKNHT